MSAHLPPTAPGANIPGGDPAGPPVRACGLPDRSPSGTTSPTAMAVAPPQVLQKRGKFGAGRVFSGRVMEMYQNGICVVSRANKGLLRRFRAGWFRLGWFLYDGVTIYRDNWLRENPSFCFL